MEVVVILIYSVSLFLIFTYSLMQLNLLFNYLKSKRKNDSSPTFDFNNPDEIPVVTIQLPLFNELYVVERLLDRIATIDYPKDKLEIQVLDDSTDESVEITAKKVHKLKELGFDISHICRVDRVGFKAGALKEGLEIAKGDYIAIFDADFLPEKDFLYQTIPFFKDENIGVVQTRWGHLNRDYSTLTKIQAFALDAHFTLEQVGRNIGGHFINFNGTAGVWRKECILDAGNWEGDTLTEDLDLSYRAQLKGWKFKFLENVVSPAELPMVISAAKSQQFRWNKGGAENFKKMKWRVLTCKKTPLKTKIHGILHLLNSSMFVNVFIVGLLSIPMLYIKSSSPEYRNYFLATSFFILSTILFFVSYWFTFKKVNGGGIKNFCKYIAHFFTFFSVAIGFSFHNSIAVIEGHLGKKSAFIRTPKFNVNSIKDSWKGNKYLTKKLSLSVIIEGLLMLYFLFGIFSAFKLMDFGLLPFYLMSFLGFGFVFINSLRTAS
ncbi:cellulose synthase family protein [Aureivirga marina]|uniref:cellulose synthase family protein n=1 Tax=Aureivirga marina TaxID=1182451 RepID=UPI0018C904C0|nr:cellulose synthase family protein [Aureivirga marina]